MVRAACKNLIVYRFCEPVRTFQCDVSAQTAVLSILPDCVYCVCFTTELFSFGVIAGAVLFLISLK